MTKQILLALKQNSNKSQFPLPFHWTLRLSNSIFLGTPTWTLISWLQSIKTIDWENSQSSFIFNWILDRYFPSYYTASYEFYNLLAFEVIVYKRINFKFICFLLESWTSVCYCLILPTPIFRFVWMAAMERNRL